jgi:hypothetical protein
LNKKHGLQIHTGSLSHYQAQQPGLYIGNKINNGGKSISVHGGATYTKRKKGGCHCGSKVAKQK